MSSATPQLPFQFQIPSEGLLSRIAQLVLKPLAEWVLALPQVNEIYRQSARGTGPASFIDRALRCLENRCTLDDADLARIPRSGPLIVVANHPFGAIDGLLLTSILRRVRPDVKLLANRMLRVIPELHETCIFVDSFGGAAAVRRNLPGMREAMRWLRDQRGALAIFPAGEVSHRDTRGGVVQDGPWDASVARLAEQTGAPVLPVYFEGNNSALFQLAGELHPRLRTILLPREMLSRRRKENVARIGSLIPTQRLASFPSATQRVDYLRIRTYILRARADTRNIGRTPPKHSQAPIAGATAPQVLAGEIDNLPDAQRLDSSGKFDVMCAWAAQIPGTLREIARLREITFRKVGEGTGRDLDLDRFDQSYLHLFVWNRGAREIVGAYRLGLTDRILPAGGVDGLYTSTLFQFSDSLMDQLDPAIELGRSFVRPEYQREFQPLLLLWKGIGRFVAQNPRYRRLFGPVSISNEYASLTKQLLISFLTVNRGLPALAKLIAPRNPPAPPGPGRRWEASLVGTIASSIEEVDTLVAEIESDRRGMPVLLRQYLKLGAKLLGFNVDPDFGDVLDGLMLIDLLDVEAVVLNRYMGKDNAARFRAFHDAAR